MKPTPITRAGKRLLRGPALLVAGGVLAASTQGVCAWVSAGAAREEARRSALEDAAHADERQTVRLADARYRELVARGIAGPERRAHWLERLSQAAATHRLADLEFELGPQRGMRIGSGNPSAEAHPYMVSTMTLKARLPHEQRLLDFLDELASGLSALLRVRSCRLERPPPQDSNADGLAISCMLDWISLQERQ